MYQLSQMTRYVSSWLGWLPVATATFDSCLLPSSASSSLGRNQDEEATMPQESSGIFTVVAIYLAMTIVLATASFCTSQDKATKDPNRSKNKRKLITQRQQQQQRPWRYSATGMALIKLIRQLATPKRSRHQMRLRLRMRLRRHLEQELKLIRELEEKGPQLGLLGAQEEEAEEANNSTYFDPYSETEP